MTRDGAAGPHPAGNGADGGVDGMRPDGDEPDEAALDALDATPLDPGEAASGAELASAAAGESLADVVERVVAELDEVTRAVEPAGSEALATAGMVFAVHGGGVLEVVLDGPVGRAALTTADASASPRGPGWVRFAPAAMDRYAADRAEAWLRYAHRRAAEASRRG